MNVKKTIKKIAAVGAGALLVGSSLLGASAASLENFPQPFVSADGQGDVQFVIGSGSPDDYLGALDVAVALQSEAVSESAVSVAGTTETVIEGGVSFGTSNDRLYLDGTLRAADAKFTDSDFPSLLADGAVEDDDGTEYDYEQKIEMGSSAAKVVFNTDDSDFDDPTLYLNLDGTSEYLWNYTITFTGDQINFTELDDSESITMAGKSFTVDKDSTNTEITMYGADTTTYLELNQPVTIDVEGTSYTLEVVGADSDGDSNNIIVDVNGVRKTVTEGFSGKINGLDIFIKDLFVTNIPVLSASANVFVGSQEVVLKDGSVKINDESVAGMDCVITGSAASVSSIKLTFTPSELNEDVEGFDELTYLLPGESVMDPMFQTFEIKFEGASSEFMAESKSVATLDQNGNELEITFTNDDGDKYTFTPYYINQSGNGNKTNYAYKIDGDEGYNGPLGTAASTTMQKDMIFVTNEKSGKEYTTVIYEVSGFDKGDDSSAAVITDDKVTLKNLMTGDDKAYKKTDEIGDSGMVLGDINATAKTVKIDASSRDDAFRFDRLYLEGGFHYINVSNITNITGGDDTVTMKLVENSDGIFGATATTTTLTVDHDADKDVTIVATGGIADDGSDYEYTLTKFGTYIVEEAEDKTRVELYVPMNEDAEVYYNAFIAPTGAKVTVTGGSDSIMTQSVNEFAVGLAVKDTDVNLANPANNLIVIGGTCINSVAAELKGVSAGTCGEASGLSANEAIIELFDLDNGKVAMLIAGWEAIDTQAACRAVATQNAALTGKAAKLTVTSVSNFQVSTSDSMMEQ